MMANEMDGASRPAQVSSTVWTWWPSNALDSLVLNASKEPLLGTPV